MSLVGNLADLGLGEILQIVQLSQKSGTLQLATTSYSGSILFYQGRVTGAMCDHELQTVAEVLVERQVVQPLVLQELLSLQKDAGPESQPPALWTHFQLDPVTMEAALRRQVEELVFSMFEWEDGTFGFVIEEDSGPLLRLDLASNRFVVTQPLNPQFLAIEGLRLRDERNRNDPLNDFLARDKEVPVPEEEHRGARERIEKAIADLQTTRPEPHQPRTGSPPNLVVIDDDAKLLRQFELHFSGPYLVHSFSRVELGLKGVRELLWAKKPVVVIADLIISRSDGGGILGGIEVLEKLRPDNPTLPIVLVSDYPNKDARIRADQLAASGFIIKPARADLDKDSALLAPFFAALESALGPASEKTEKIAPLSLSAREEPSDMLTPLGRELMQGVETHFDRAEGEPAPGGGELGTLKSLLMELLSPANKETVTLLVLRYAAEIFSRSVLLLIAQGEVVGLGGYAAGMPNDQFVRLVRTVRLPLQQSRALTEVVRTRQVRRSPLSGTDAERTLARRVGIDPSQPVFIAPLVSNERIAAILLGDNQQLGKDLGDTQGLEIFLLQAGLAMERTLLERRLKELAQRG